MRLVFIRHPLLKFFTAKLVVFAVFAGTSLSANLASSWSVAVAKRAVDSEGCGSVSLGNMGVS